MIEIENVWYDVKNIRKMKFEDGEIYISFYQEDSPLTIPGDKQYFDYLLARVSLTKNQK